MQFRCWVKKILLTFSLLYAVASHGQSCAIAAAEHELGETKLPYEVQRYLTYQNQQSLADMIAQALSDSLMRIKEYAVLPVRLFAVISAWVIISSLCADVLRAKDTLLSKCVNCCIGMGFWLSICSLLAPVISASQQPAEQAVNTMNLSLPLLAGIIAAGGAPATSLQFQLLCGSLCSVFSSVSSLLVEKIVAFALGLSAAAAISNGVFQKAPSTICRFASKALTLCSGAFMAYAKLQLSLSAVTDRSVIRSGVAMAFSAVPVLGSTFSSSAGAVAAALASVKLSLGAACIAALLALMLPAMLQLLMIRAALMAGESVCDIVKESSGLKLKLQTFLACVDLLAAVQALTSVLFIFMLYSIVTTLR